MIKINNNNNEYIDYYNKNNLLSINIDAKTTK